MKVKTLLAKASKCKTQEDANELLGVLKQVFSETKPLSKLCVANEEAYMEKDNQPFVRFELNQELSGHYVTTIRPEIRDGNLVVEVETCHMRDGFGMQSQSWVVIEGMDDIIEADDVEISIAKLARQAKELAISNHAELIERLGVPRPVALAAARKSR